MCCKKDNLGQTQKVSVIKNCLGGEDLQLIATLTLDEQEACNSEKGFILSMVSLLQNKYYFLSMKSFHFLQVGFISFIILITTVIGGTFSIGPDEADL